METPAGPSIKSFAIERLFRLIRKELRETLRDRRTLVTLLVMPVIVYPLLGLVFHRFLIRYARTEETPTTSNWVLGVESEQQMRILHSVLIRGDLLIKAGGIPQRRQDLLDSLSKLNPAEYGFMDGDRVDYQEYGAEPVEMVSRGSVDAAVIVRPPTQDLGSGTMVNAEILYRTRSATSLGAARFIEQRFHANNQDDWQSRMNNAGLSISQPTQVTTRAVADDLSPVLSLNSLIPLVLILMTITGAVYPAIDLTAGERERGTLEPLIAAPIPRFMLLLSKYVAVVTVAMLTASVNMVGMAITVWSTGLLHLLGNESTSAIGLITQTIGLLGLFSAFFSAVLLVLTSIARSFKEAQAYLIPLMLVSLAPGVMSLVPDLEYTPSMAFVPVLNMVLLARDLLSGEAQPLIAVLAIGATVLYSLAAIGLAARLFGADAVLYGSPGAWSDWVRRPDVPSRTVSLDVAMLMLAVLFPVFYLASHANASFGAASPAVWLLLAAGTTIVLFALFPLGIVWYFRVTMRSGLGWRLTHPAFLLAGVVLGLSLWPMALEIVLRTLPTDLPAILASDGGIWRQMAASLEGIRSLPIAFVVVCMAIVPAICEELCFRGLILGAFTNVASRWQSILGSAILFGSFHVVMGGVLMLERWLPSTMLGLVLAWLAIRSRSLFPGILLHATHNSLMLLAGHNSGLPAWQNIAQAGHVPWTWIGVALTVASLTFFLVETSSTPKAS